MLVESYLYLAAGRGELQRPSISLLGIIRLDDRAQCIPGNDPVHRLQKRIAPGRLAMPFKTLVCCHCQSLLFHWSSLCLLLSVRITFYYRDPFTYSALP
jgi:hypothetical protein